MKTKIGLLASLLIFGIGSAVAAPFSKIQNDFLDCLQSEAIPTSIYLINGIKLQGTVRAFDASVIVLESAAPLMVYHQSIANIVPALSSSGQGTCSIVK